MDPFEYLRGVAGVAPTSGIATIDSITDIFNLAINILIGSGFAISIITIGYAMFQYAMSKGEPKETAVAYNTALWGLTAAIVSILAVSLRYAVIKLFGVTNADISGETNVVPNL